MSWPVLLLAIAALAGAGATGCASTRRAGVDVHSTPRNTVAAAPGRPRSRVAVERPFMGDGDADNPSDIDGDNAADADPDNDSKTHASERYPDRDDAPELGYGHPAATAERRAIVSVVKRYYDALASGDGELACASMLTTFAESVPEDFGRRAGPSYLRGGDSCPAVITLLSRHYREQLGAAIDVMGVRVERTLARAFVGSPTMPASGISLERQGGRWAIAQVFGAPLQ